MVNSRDKERDFDRFRERQVFTGKCDTRLTAAEDSALDRLAERNGVSRSTIMRKALQDFIKFNEDGAVSGEE